MEKLRQVLTSMIQFRIPYFLFLFVCAQIDATSLTQAAQWSIPLTGNSFRTSPGTGEVGVRNDLLAWKDGDEVYSIYFHADRTAEIELSILARVPEGRTILEISVGKQSFEKELAGEEFREHKFGVIKIAKAGYCRVDLRGINKVSDLFAEVKDLMVASTTEGLILDFVKNNEGQMFYWGRRGPSVHLSFDVPKDPRVEFAYSEITVPAGLDPIGSYFMANGFAEGYFGIQVNSENERRVLFSVWSPFQTDNPKEIPAEQRVVALDSGPDVHLGEFGNEGSGGQSYLRYPWKTDVTYRFLTQVKPDGNETTIYTAWFSEANSKQWRLIAKFRRPMTNTHLKGFHSFLENFDPTRGHLERRGFYANQWVRDTEGEWHECTSSHFSVDATGQERHRLDFAGGSDRTRFYLRNGGFFNQTVAPGAKFVRDSTKQQKPRIDFESLP